MTPTSHSKARTAGPWDADEQNQRNQAALLRPEPGDYWHEMFIGVLIVLAVGPETVTFCEKKVDTDAHHWTWDISETKRVLLEDFAIKLRYSSSTMRGKTWADVAPKRYVEFSTAYASLPAPQVRG